MEEGGRRLTVLTHGRRRESSDLPQVGRVAGDLSLASGRHVRQESRRLLEEPLQQPHQRRAIRIVLRVDRRTGAKPSSR